MMDCATPGHIPEAQGQTQETMSRGLRVPLVILTRRSPCQQSLQAFRIAGVDQRFFQRNRL